MLYLLVSLLGILITLLFVIGTHEFAHFIVARMLGVKVLRFSIGFGKTLLKWRDKRGTEYVFALIPLGGYVKMLDENEGAVPSDQLSHAFNRQPIYKKALIVLAGPVSNLLCAFALYWAIFVMGFVTVKPIIGSVTPDSIAAQSGLSANQQIISIDNTPTPSWTSILFRLLAHIGNKDSLDVKVLTTTNQEQTHTLKLSDWKVNDLTPDLLGSIGITPYQPNIPLVIGQILPDSPAARSPLKVGDKLVSLNKQPIKDWSDVMTTVVKHPGETILLTVERQNKLIHVPLQIGTKHTLLWQSRGFIGIGPKFEIPKGMIHRVQYSPLTAISYAWKEMMDFTYFNMIIFGKLITGKLSLQSLGGPITIFETAGEALNTGLLAFISFLAFLSISIGIINLIPIPGLDGGHLLLQLVESIIRRPIPEKVMIFLYRLGFIFLFFILLHAFVNDILRL